MRATERVAEPLARAARKSGVLLAAAALAATATACGSETTLPGRASTPTASPTTGAAEPAPGVIESATPGSRRSEPAPRCATGQLDVRAGGESGALGHAGLVLKFTNHTRQVCSLYGFPGVDAGRPGTAQAMSANWARQGYLFQVGAPKRVTLGPGGTASAGLEWLPGATKGSQCHSYETLEVTPPNDTRYATLQQKTHICIDFEVHPVVPGSTAQSTTPR